MEPLKSARTHIDAFLRAGGFAPPSDALGFSLPRRDTEKSKDNTEDREKDKGDDAMDTLLVNKEKTATPVWGKLIPQVAGVSRL